jgi:hypothetical protein
MRHRTKERLQDAHIRVLNQTIRRHFPAWVAERGFSEATLHHLDEFLRLQGLTRVKYDDLAEALELYCQRAPRVRMAILEKYNLLPKPTVESKNER